MEHDRTITKEHLSKMMGAKAKTKSWDAVYAVVRKIPRGRVMTYGELAKKLRLPGGARVAGYAMAGCPNGSGIPWHRVVGAGGRLLIREPYASLQRKLLETEGVSVTGARIDMNRYSWLAKRAKPKPPTVRKRSTAARKRRKAAGR